MIRSRHILSALILLAGVIILMATNRTNFTSLVLAYSALFAIYHLVVHNAENARLLTFWISIAILLRFVTLFFFPNLSDDIYRFIWDGSLSASGQNPYLLTPSTFMAEGHLKALDTASLYSLLNSPDYFSVYPPFCQFLFWIGADLFSGHWFAQAAFIKGTILLAETGSITLIYLILKRLHRPVHWVLIYALNPLVILELTGNAHFEGWMIFFMLASFYAYLMRKPLAGGLFLGMGILSKLIPALMAPFLIKRLNRRGILVSFLGGAGIILIAFLPFIQASLPDTAGNSLGLYFQKFEFNASIYYIFRWIIGWVAGYNPISYLGPALAILFAFAALWLYASEKKPEWQRLPALMVILLSLYFFLSTTVHPWYISTIIAFASLTNIRYPVVWSFLIFSTYITYSTSDYTENMWFVFMEYAVLASYIIFEYKSGETELSRFFQQLHKKRALSE